eukprot:COSAG04_NODE_165_length_21747_cov_200.788387_1_plen_412_part_10
MLLRRLEMAQDGKKTAADGQAAASAPAASTEVEAARQGRLEALQDDGPAAAAAPGPRAADAGAEAFSDTTKYLMVGVYAASLFAVGSGFGARGPSLTSVARQVGLLDDDGAQCRNADGSGGDSAAVCSRDECPESDIDKMAWAQTSFNIGFIVCSFGAGFVMDGVRRWHWVLALSGAIAALAMVLQTQITAPGALYATYGALGVACAFPATATAVGPIWVWLEKAGPHVHFVQAMFGVGMGLAPFLVSLNRDMYCKGSWTLGDSNFHVAFIITAGVTGAIAVTPLLFKSPSPPVQTEAEKAGAQAAAAAAGGDGSSFFARPRVLWTLFFIYKGVYVMTENSLGGWIAAYAELSCLVSAVDAPKLGTLFFWCYTVTRLVSAAASTRVTATVILIVCCEPRSPPPPPPPSPPPP